MAVRGASRLGLGDVARVVRMLAHVEADPSRQDITHVCLRGAAARRSRHTVVRSVPDDGAGSA